MKNQALLNQKRAADYNISSWVMASAGSGKTKILTDRVLNLLLKGTPPEKILCLTFTKAAAKEMIERISSMLSSWVNKSDEELEQILSSLHGDFEKIVSDKNRHYAPLMQKARVLFAEVMEVYGGMKIMTIHGFCQSVLKRFPLEAKVSPYFEVIEDSKNKELMEKARQQVMENEKNIELLNFISSYVSEEEFTKSTQTLLKNRDKLDDLAINFEDKLHDILGISTLDKKSLIKAHISENISEIKALISYYQSSKNKTAPSHAKALEDILLGHGNISNYFSVFLTKEGSLKAKPSKDFMEAAPTMRESVEELYTLLLQIEMYKCTDNFIKLALDIIKIYEGLKRKDCYLDYDDLINDTKRLLSNKELAPWVLYKLDGGIEHILVDEAQDTSPQQWSVIQSLTEEIFSGEGSEGNKDRTLFVVGDRKQSIYSFQGANIEIFDNMRDFFQERITHSRHKFEEIPINISFRSSSEVLNFVDMVYANDVARNGVLKEDEDLRHIPYFSDLPGKVELWDLCEHDKEDKDSEKEVWKIPLRQDKKLLPKEELSVKIATEIKDMIDNKYIPANKDNDGKYRKVEPKDIMILVRHRDEFASEVIRNLKILNVPVAGIDRLSLLEHIAVQDLISLGKFLLCPDDNLSLAEVLKSPLIGIAEDDLYSLAYNRNDKSIWQKIKETSHYSFGYLNDILRKVDYINPFELYSYILSVKGGRKEFLSRLGEESLDALDEFLNLVKNYCDNNVPSLQSLICYLERDEVEIKREQEQSNLVRLMTVHGSKGLQAPIIFLPDTTGMGRDVIRVLWIDGIPLWIPKSDIATKKIKELIEQEKDIRKKEYRRLLYVAMTRAAQELYICGYGHKKKSPEGNWYDLISKTVTSPENIDKFERSENGRYILQYRNHNIKEKIATESIDSSIIQRPIWFDEPTPTDDTLKPLAPSHINEEDIIATNPLSTHAQGYARGTLIHKILEFLPTITSKDRQNFVKIFLDNVPDISQKNKDEIYTSFNRLLSDQKFQTVINSNGISEAPICAVIDNNIINGKIDRLIINEQEVIIIDYKSNVSVPSSLSDVPRVYKGQMDSYRQVLKKIYPEKNIKTYIFWLETVSLMEIY